MTRSRSRKFSGPLTRDPDIHVTSHLRFILEAEMTDLLAVVWCVTPQVGISILIKL